MVIVLKNRAAIYQREAAEMLHNISLYPGLTEEQLCRFFPEKEATAKTLLAHMLKEGRVYRAENCRYYANQEARNNADKDLSRCVWVLLDFIDQVEYHTVAEFPAAILCFANGELYEIVPIPQGKETMICQLLHKPQKDAGKRIVVDPVIHDMKSINARVVANMDVQRAGYEDVEQRIVYDDSDDWKASEINILQFGATVIPFSKAPKVLSRMAGAA